MADFTNIKSNRVDTGDIMSDDKAAEQRRQRMLSLMNSKAEKPQDKDADLSSIESVVGSAREEMIPCTRLIKPPQEWNVFPDASDDSISKMSTSIYHYGLLHKINVWEQADGKYMVLDGNTRVKCFEHIYDALKDDKPEEARKYLSIPARVYSMEQLSEEDAQRIFIVSNTDQRNLSVKTTSEAYCRLMALEKKKAFYRSGIYSRDAAAKQANVKPTTFSKYLRIAKLYTPLLDSVDAGEITTGVAYSLSLMPEFLQKYVYAKALHLKLTSQSAKAISSCLSTNEIEDELERLNGAPKYYKYTALSKVRKPSGTDILPLFVEKNRFNEVLNRFDEAVDKSDFSPELKDYLHSVLSRTLPRESRPDPE